MTTFPVDPVAVRAECEFIEVFIGKIGDIVSDQCFVNRFEFAVAFDAARKRLYQGLQIILRDDVLQLFYWIGCLYKEDTFFCL